MRLLAAASRAPASRRPVATKGPPGGAWPTTTLEAASSPAWASQPFGNASVPPNLVALQLIPGAWHFQCWFRDTAAGGALLDLGDATQVTLVP